MSVEELILLLAKLNAAIRSGKVVIEDVKKKKNSERYQGDNGIKDKGREREEDRNKDGVDS